MEGKTGDFKEGIECQHLDVNLLLDPPRYEKRRKVNRRCTEICTLLSVKLCWFSLIGHFEKELYNLSCIETRSRLLCF